MSAPDTPRITPLPPREWSQEARDSLAGFVALPLHVLDDRNALSPVDVEGVEPGQRLVESAASGA